MFDSLMSCVVYRLFNCIVKFISACCLFWYNCIIRKFLPFSVNKDEYINHLSHGEQVVSMQEAIADWSARCHVHIRDR